MIKVFNGSRRTLGGKSDDLFMQLSFSFREKLHHFKGAKLAVFMAICLHSDQDGKAFPSYTLLEKETGFDRPTIAKAISELCAIEIDGSRVLCRYQDQDSSGRYVGKNNYIILPSADEALKADLAVMSKPKPTILPRPKISSESELGGSSESELGGSSESELGGSSESEPEVYPMQVEQKKEEPERDPSIQDLPSPTVAAFPPSPKAMIVNQVLGNQPSGKGESGFVGLAQAATDKFNGNGKKPAEVHHLDGLTKQVESWGMTMPAFREMVDAFLDRYGMVEIANLDTELGIKTLTKAQSKVKEICAHGEQFRTVAGLSGAFSDWYATDWRGKKGEKPTGDQLVEHIGVMKSRKPMPAQPTSEAAKKEDTAFWSGELVDIGLKYNVTARKIKPGTGRKDPVTNKYIEEVYEDEEPAVEAQKAA